MYTYTCTNSECPSYLQELTSRFYPGQPVMVEESQREGRMVAPHCPGCHDLLECTTPLELWGKE